MVIRRWLLWLVCIGGLAWLLFGCGKLVPLRGAECVADLGFVNKGGTRMGCIVFQNDVYSWPLIYKPDEAAPGGQFFYCPSYLPKECNVTMTGVTPPSTASRDEIAVIAFPPPELLKQQNVNNVEDFLGACSKIFDPRTPTPITCWNDSPVSADTDMSRCWYIFQIKYFRGRNVGTCSRWISE